MILFGTDCRYVEPPQYPCAQFLLNSNNRFNPRVGAARGRARREHFARLAALLLQDLVYKHQGFLKTPFAFRSLPVHDNLQ